MRRANTTGSAAPRWYQVNDTGGAVAAALPQASTLDPDGANVMSRFAPSLAVDRAGNLALGYSTSSATTNPALKYAGRLAADPINTFSQTEQVLFQGAATQQGNCGGGICTRWGDYSAMTLDPDGCTFWYTNEYYAANGLSYRTRIGAFTFPACTPVTSGALQGTVTTGGSPIAGATVTLGSRTTTTNASGFYEFTNLPAGTYPSATASFPGYGPQTVVSIAVAEGAATVRDFALAPAPASACLTDTAQADFLTGVATNCDLTASGEVTLLDAAVINQQNLSVTNSGFGFNTTNWTGQTFTPSVNGQLTRVDLDLFCSGCTGTTPNILVSIRATDAVTLLPTGGDLATATIPGFSSGAGGYFAANFTTPLPVVGGTRYAVMARPIANPSAGIYALRGSYWSPYANGQRFTSRTAAPHSWTDDRPGLQGLPEGRLRTVGHVRLVDQGCEPGAGGDTRVDVDRLECDALADTTAGLPGGREQHRRRPVHFRRAGRHGGDLLANGASLAQFNGPASSATRHC